MKIHLTKLLILPAFLLSSAGFAQTPTATPKAPDVSAPAAPVDVAPNFSVAWDDTVNGAGTLDGYRLKWGAVSGGPYTGSVDVTPQTTKTKAFTNFALGSWFMVVTAFKGTAVSSPSNEIAVNVLPAAPGNFRITSGFANISTRAKIEPGDAAAIAGFIMPQPGEVVVRAIGPSLEPFLPGQALKDTTLELHDGQGALLRSNDDWRTDINAAVLIASGLAPGSDKEAAMLMTNLPAGAYTAIARGGGLSTSGIGLVEVYQVQ